MMKASVLLTSVAALALVLTACTPGDTTEPESVSAEQPDTNVGEEQLRDYSQGDLEVLSTPAVAGASTFIRAVSDLGGVEFLFDLDGDGKYETESDSDGILHTFDEAGEYPVSVKVTYGDGRVREGSTVVVVTEPSNISIDFSPPTEENGRILTDYTAKQNSDGSISVVINGLGQGEAFGIRFIAADTPDDKTFMSPLQVRVISTTQMLTVEERLIFHCRATSSLVLARLSSSLSSTEV
jgi:hypothetical protein